MLLFPPETFLHLYSLYHTAYEHAFYFSQNFNSKALTKALSEISNVIPET